MDETRATSQAKISESERKINTKVGRNDSCPCGSGKKYKHCCIGKSVEYRRVFSWQNYRLLYAYSPFWSLEDWNHLKGDDGAQTRKANKEYYWIKTCFGSSLYPEIATRIYGDSDYIDSQILCDQNLLLKYVQSIRVDLRMWPFQFSTTAFIANEFNPGFALVSVTDKPGKFILKSEIYPALPLEHDQFLTWLSNQTYLLWPTGELTLERNDDVFIVPPDLLIKYLSEVRKVDFVSSFITPSEMREYLSKASNKDQYEDNQFLKLAIKYRKHCLSILELLTDEEDLKTYSELSKYKTSAEKWSQKIQKLYNSTSDKDIDSHPDLFEEYDAAINQMVDDMQNIVNEHQDILQQIQTDFTNRYSDLDHSALTFLIQAETLYLLNKEQVVDFAPIVLEYCKVLEKQLRKIINAMHVEYELKSLGSLLRYIEENKIPHLYDNIKYIEDITHLRNNSAHIGQCSQEDVEKIRSYYFNKKLLDSICQ